jgi:hypothetical protein
MEFKQRNILEGCFLFIQAEPAFIHNDLIQRACLFRGFEIILLDYAPSELRPRGCNKVNGIIAIGMVGEKCNLPP